MTVIRVCPRCQKEYPAGTYSAHRSSHTSAHRWVTYSKSASPKSKHRPQVVRLVGLGMLAADVGRKLGISRERVRQIWLSETGLAIPPLPARQPVDRDSRRVRRFWARVQVAESGCWLWTGSRYPTGYGSYRAGPKSGYAHREAYRAVKGPIPAGLTIDHLCRVPPCVNPDHLEAVTQRENTLRSPIAVAAINARKTHCPQGHPYSPENTYSRPGRLRGRACRTCHALSARAQTARKTAARRLARKVAA